MSVEDLSQLLDAHMINWKKYTKNDEVRRCPLAQKKDAIFQ